MDSVSIVCRRVRLMLVLAALVTLWPSGVALANDVVTARGIVFHDVSGDGQFDVSAGDMPLPGVAVSNGRDVVVTDEAGRYELAVRGQTSLFVIEPRGYHAGVDELNIPRFYYIHSPEGATGTRYRGLASTGPLPESIDFALYEREETDAFDVLVFGDTQPRNLRELYYLNHDTFQEVVGLDAAFGVTLGDLVFDNLNVLEPLNQAIAHIGLPWRHVVGNHDIDFTSPTDRGAKGAYNRIYGPTYYAFTYGPAHFIVVDTVFWDGEARRYFTALGEDQLQFLRNEFARIDDDTLIVLLGHIPFIRSTAWRDTEERDAFYALLAGRSHAVSLVSHRHLHFHDFITASDEGYVGDQPHHQIVVGTACGSWWMGAPDEYGIPHAMMSDGAPTGYAIFSVEGNAYRLDYQPARRPSDYRMHIHTPDAVKAGDETAAAIVTANVFNALPDANVTMRVAGGDWIAMERAIEQDPFVLAVQERERQIEGIEFRRAGGAAPSAHLWRATLPADLEPGMHLIEVRSEDRWHVYNGRRIIHITE